ncbi:hypothetical protein GCM10027405_11040 [Arthrobacter alkaliphilus]
MEVRPELAEAFSSVTESIPLSDQRFLIDAGIIRERSENARLNSPFNIGLISDPGVDYVA